MSYLFIWQMLLNETRYILLKAGWCSTWDDQNNKPTTRANLPCFTSDKVSKQKVCPQETCETWCQLRYLIKETATHDFIGYFIGGCYWYRLISDNLSIISCIPNHSKICIPQLSIWQMSSVKLWFNENWRFNSTKPTPEPYDRSKWTCGLSEASWTQVKEVNTDV